MKDSTSAAPTVVQTGVDRGLLKSAAIAPLAPPATKKVPTVKNQVRTMVPVPIVVAKAMMLVAAAPIDDRATTISSNV